MVCAERKSSAAPDESHVIEWKSISQKISDLDRPQGRRLERVVRRQPFWISNAFLGIKSKRGHGAGFRPRR